METAIYIPKGRKLEDAENYALLRSKGMEYIEKLSSTLWTDYNTHDPGITIVEALCYAITELGYRTSFDTRDLLATADGSVTKDQAFFTAREIFTTEPVTVEDYRKLLTDIIGIHNAWLFPQANVEEVKAAGGLIPKAEVPVYPLCAKDSLVYDPTDHIAIDIRGLYNVMLDLDATDEFGDLNSGNIIYTFSEPQLQRVQVEIVLPRWNEVDLDFMKDINDGVITIQSIAVNKKPHYWEIVVTYSDLRKFTYYVVIALRQKVKDLEVLIEKRLKEIDLEDPSNTPDPTFPLHKSFFQLYYNKLQETISLLKEAKTTLHAHRCLCEDFKQIDTVIPVPIGFCADIEVRPDTDIEQVLATVYFQIEEYLNPDIKFYSLQEMVNKKIPAEDIFEGPKLEHGFIDTEELMNTQLRSEIRVSDIINLIMDVEGVVSVKNVLLSEYDKFGQPILPSQKWCLHLQPYHKPILKVNFSKILFFKDNLPFKANAQEAADILSVLRGINERAKLKGHANDWPAPEGNPYQLDDYYSVQYELPQTYGISKDGLPSTASPERKAQALQLRAYLLFYDQLLANFFSQLHHAKDLFSLDSALQQTYFTQYLTDVKDIGQLYKKVNDLRTGLDVSLQDALKAPLAPGALPLQDAANNNQHYELIESLDTFYDRRNRFLDHLLARFAESFNEYVLMLYTITNGEKIKKENDKLIKDKIAFLKEYPVVSGERGKAFDYLAASWNTNNVSGLEKRVSRLTGIANYNRRDLFCYFNAEIINEGTVLNPKYVFQVVDLMANIYLVSVQQYDHYEQIELIINKVYDSLTHRERYVLDQVSASKYFVRLQDGYGKMIASSQSYFTKESTAKAHIEDLLVDLAPPCDPEGMFLVEHLLLRPHFPVTVVAPQTKEEKYKLLQVCLGEDCDFCGEEDPYSFRASVILPYWPERFRDLDFRRFFEKTMRTEAPAHLSLKICWVNYTTMQKFQEVVNRWLVALRDYESDLIKDNTTKQDTLRETSNKMVEFLANVHSEYPEARLHDCETGVTNPVTLGSTVLGSF
jgi:uncharacterized protein YegP (UPF0339 family)